MVRRTRKILYPSLPSQAQRATCACYVVKKTWQREAGIVAALRANQICSLGIFWLLKEYSGTAGWGWQPYLQELQEESCCEGQQHIQFTWTSPSTVQQMQGNVETVTVFGKRIPQLYVEKRLSTHLSYRLLVTFLPKEQCMSLAKKFNSLFMMKKKSPDGRPSGPRLQ